VREKDDLGTLLEVQILQIM